MLILFSGTTFLAKLRNRKLNNDIFNVKKYGTTFLRNRKQYMEEIFNVKLDIGILLSGQSMGYNKTNNFWNS